MRHLLRKNADDDRAPSSAPWVAIAMMVAVLSVAGLAFWDSRREAAAALNDLATEQAALTQGIASALDMRAPPPTPDGGIVDPLRALERPGITVILFRREGASTWTRADGSTADAPALERALLQGASWLRLSRDDSARLGLPARAAVAGIAPMRTDSLGHGSLAIVTTARQKRDRELRAQARLVLSVLFSGGLVVLFGGIALRKQRTELQLASKLRVAEVQRERDERLVRADKLATLGALATGIAHEVSTPLGVIVGRAEQIAPKVAHDERSQRAVAAILEQADRIRVVIRGFLALARGDAPLFDHVDPATIAAKSIDLVEHRFTKANVSLESHVAPGLAQIACEPRLLEQALVNLLLNACDACEDGGHVMLRVTGDADHVTFTVDDDGVGADPESVALMVQPFFTTKPSERGTGLGLAIANEIVSHHRGTLRIAPQPSTYPRGIRACIEVPTLGKGP